MTHPAAPRARAGRALLVILSLVAGACGGGSEHASDGDTGAAAPATVRDMSATPNVPDSTAGVSNATGQPMNPGDTLGARAADSSKGPNAGKPAGP